MNTIDLTRAQLLEAIREISVTFPELRLGQLMGLFADQAGRVGSSGICELEDTEALAATETIIEYGRNRVASQTDQQLASAYR